MEKRKQPRFRTQFDVLYSTGPAEGAGVLADLSYSGARLEQVSQQHIPEIGTRVRLYVFVQPVAPFEIIGHVVRATDSGFAIAYEIDDAEVRRLVDDVSAIVFSA
ncbi:MAG: PilZ domain-containing protein [Myxococcota bacterium]|nr:PilZ domain-containing protein [Myxococcota bacterium]